MQRRPIWKETTAGLIAVILWFLVFAGGLSIDSRPFREVLAPSPAAPPTQLAGLVPVTEASPALAPPHITRLQAFAGVVVFYTPLNVALLTLSAGLVGGCASRLTFARSQKEESAPAEGAPPDPSLAFRTEPPVASLLRSFLVYLAFIAGIFIATNDPFANPTSDQYVRMAGLLSFVSFVVGYDPTRIQGFLSLKVGGGSKPS